MAEPVNIIVQPTKKRTSKKPTVKLTNPLLESAEAAIPEPVPTKKEKKEVVEREACGICAEYYTPCIRRKMVCKYCNQDTCSKCIEHYLISKHEDAHCMHCRVNYSDDALRQICTKTYLQQTYFQHRQAVLINRSRAQLPGLQDEALQQRKRREMSNEVQHVRNQINQLRKEIDVITKEYSQIHSQNARLRINNAETEEEKEAIRAQKNALRLQMNEVEERILERRREIVIKREDINAIYLRYRDARANQEEDAPKEEEKKKFIRRCTREDCKGFLSTAWKCGMCEWFSCSKCFAVKGESHDSPHECTKEALETAALIRKNCKPCPKCGEQIEHGGGCSQMWCISCNTPWDWNTGQIVTSGPIHNPLYYEWQRRTGGAVPRNPADIPCGGYPRQWELVRFPRDTNRRSMHKYDEFYRICQELRHISERQFRSHMNEANTNQIHIRFLLHDFDEKSWGRYLALEEKKKKRDAEIQEVFAAFHMVAIELINRVENYRDDQGRTFTNITAKEAEDFIDALLVETQELIRMINTALRNISITHRCSIIHIEHSDDVNYRYGYYLKSSNFSHEVKKTRGKKEVVADVNHNITIEDEPLILAEPVDHTEDSDDDTEDDESVVEFRDPELNENVHQPQQDNGYESDNSVSSDIQAAIEASLKI